jgi:hypothetical protein
MERLFKLEIKSVAEGGSYFENKNLSRWSFQKIWINFKNSG